MNEYLMYGTFVCIGLIVACCVANIVIARKNEGKTSKTVNRVMYIAGIAAVIMNAIRMTFRSGDYNGTLIFANVVVLISLLISFRRMERGEENLVRDEKED